MKTIIATLIYSVCYQIIHTEYLVALFGYAGYYSNGFSGLDFTFTLLFILLPLIIKPKEFLFLDIIFSFFYLLLYIPILITYLNHYQSTANILLNQSFIVLGFLIIFFVARIRIFKGYSCNFKMPGRLFLFWLTIFLMCVLGYTYKDTYSLVSFENVYQLRDETPKDSVVAGYLVLWLTYFIGPLVLINGLLKKDRYFIVLGTFSIIFVYGIAAGKIALFIPVLIVGGYFVLKHNLSFLRVLCYSFTGLMLLMFIFSAKFYMLAAVILMRTFGIAGLLTYQYNEFFKVNSYTFFSHVNFVNFFTEGYPYPRPLGFMVSSFFMENSENNANANFIATDGIASFGFAGIIIICAIVGIYLSFMKSQVKQSNNVLVGLAFIPFCFIILNVGFFTSLLSGGFIFLNFYYFLKSV